MAFRKSHELLQAGAIAPAFELKRAGGGPVSLKRMLARGPVLLAFFKISCPVCRFTFPFLERLHRQDPGFQIVGISQDDPAGTETFWSEHGLTFACLLDEATEGYPASNAFGISHVPSLFLVEPDGHVSSVIEGFSRKAIEDLGARIGATPFQPGEDVPSWKAG
jgi:peroxiredoxin